VKRAIASIPLHFKTDTYIEGLSATDIFTLNSALGAAIEDQVVTTLNANRQAWDPDGEYALYGFVRQPQTFPDVLLKSFSVSLPPEERIILGIELKGWYLLSKEREPSFRYTVTPDACADADLLVVVPWALKNVLSGSPVVFEPYVVSAKEAAQLRNYYWQFCRNTEADTSIRTPSGVQPYPAKPDAIADVPARDTGGNFGRLARAGVMEDYKTRILQQPLCGISSSSWLDFFKSFTESSSPEDWTKAIARLRAKLAGRKVQAEVSDPYLQILDIIERSL